MFMHIASFEFLISPKESVENHKTLSLQVGSGDETKPEAVSQVKKVMIYGSLLHGPSQIYE